MTVALKLISSETLDSRRNARRARVMLAAKMETDAGEIPVVIRDISSSGARIDTPVSPEVGSHVTLRREAIAVAAEVRWRKDGRIGLLFAGSIDEAALLIPVSRTAPSLPAPPPASAAAGPRAIVFRPALVR